MRTTAALLAGLVLCGTAQAASPHLPGVAAYLGQSELESSDDTGSATIDGRELGVRGALNLGRGFFLRGEYGAVNGNDNIDGVDVDTEVDELRLGGGYTFEISDAASLYAEANYAVISVDASASAEGVELTSSVETNGFVVAVGGSFSVLPSLSVYGRAGYISVEDEDSNEKGNGPDFLAGVDYSLSDVFGAFAEFRYTTLNFDDGDNDLSGYRGGLRLKF